MSKTLSAIVALSTVLSWSAQAKFKCNPKLDLTKIDTNLVELMEETPVKYDKDCKQIRQSVAFLFSGLTQQELTLHRFVEAKDEQRKKFKMETEEEGEISLDQQGRAGEQGNDKHYNLADGLSSRNQGLINIEEMDKKQLFSGSLEQENMPWSDDYWAIGKGVLSYRYNDDAMNDVAEDTYADNPDNLWKNLFDFFNNVENNSGNYVERQKITVLSPAEKYDLLMGDSEYSFSKWMWKQGEQYYYGDTDGDGKPDHKVETWMGICHGWAPASYMLPRPTKAITVKSAQGGHDILFFPSDLKSLASQLWAQTQLVDQDNNRVRTKFIGGRCNDKDPEKDENGRIKSQDCFDNNPGSWHKAIVNQIGVSKRSTVMDATYDYEVWNHPIVSYNYEYFNPETKRRVRKLEDATVKRSKFKSDKFKKYRDEKTKKFVGVIMEVTYAVETYPAAREEDSIHYDAHHTAYYTYDLELDNDGNIIGGEWYSNKHPDFLWTPPVNAVSRSDYEINFGEYFQNMTWNVLKDSVPEEWSFFAKPIVSNGQRYMGASEQGQPIGHVVEALLDAASMETIVDDGDK